MTNILVLGSSGQIGNYLCNHLTSKNYNVIKFDIESIALLSTMYFRGHGVVQNDKAAFSNAEYAALRGDSIAQNNLAYFYYLGLVVGKDELMAFALWSLSIQAGNKQATTNYMMAKDNLNHIQIKAAKKIQKTVIAQIKENKKDK